MKPSTTSDSAHEGLGAWAWGVLVWGLAAILSPIAFVLLLGGLCVLVMKYRLAGVLLGLMIALICGITGFNLMTDPKTGDGSVGLIFLFWAGLGLWIAWKSLTRKPS